jgi:hypothetical protein
MTYIKKIAFLCFLIPLMSCSVQKEGTPKIKQGVFGSVTWVEGNMMPSPDAPKSAGKKGVEREIQIYEVVTFKDVKGEAPLFEKVIGKLVKTVKSNAKGFYECELPVGQYSVFTVEEGTKLFANNSDGEGKINSVKIENGKVVQLDIQINYKAAY